MEPSILYVFLHMDIPEPSTILRHAHSCWQIDICLEVPFRLNLKHSSEWIGPEEYVLIPPGIQHGFDYVKAGSSYLSLRFDFTNNQNYVDVFRHQKTPQEQILLQALINMGKLQENEMVNRTQILQIILKAFLTDRLTSSEKNIKPSFSEKARQLIARQHGRPIQVSEIAQSLCYSERHAAALFRQEVGHSLKHEIDLHRIEESRRMLKYTDLSIGQIAEILGFNDIYSFSRFFKQHARKSARDFRKEIHRQKLRPK